MLRRLLSPQARNWLGERRPCIEIEFSQYINHICQEWWLQKNSQGIAFTVSIWSFPTIFFFLIGLLLMKIWRISFWIVLCLLHWAASVWYQIYGCANFTARSLHLFKTRTLNESDYRNPIISSLIKITFLFYDYSLELTILASYLILFSDHEHILFFFFEISCISRKLYTILLSIKKNRWSPKMTYRELEFN